MNKFRLRVSFVFTIALTIFHPQGTHAQSVVHGSVLDAQGKPVASANVLLMNVVDSTLVKGMLTDHAGVFSFKNIAVGKYFITSTFIGYETTRSPAFGIRAGQTEFSVETLSLRKDIVNLSGVTVTAKKPFLEQKIDRLVVNVANNITSAGNTVLEVLERSPGVMVDHQNNSVSMNGKEGVVIMINGKVTHMPAEAVVQMLSGMSSGNVQKIELISTPPASFDAEGNAGFINIVLKANNNFGTNGSYSATLGYGKGLISGANFNFNHRRGKINFYGDLSFSGVKKPLIISSYNQFSNDGTTTESYYDGDRRETVYNYNGRLGLDYQAGKHTILGVLVSGYYNNYSQYEHNTSTLFVNAQKDSMSRLDNSEINDWKNFSANINLQHDFKQEGEKIAVNIDYIHYGNNEPFQYHTSVYDGDGAFIYDKIARAGKTTPLNFWVGAIDFSKKFSNKVSMDAGVKQTFSLLDNEIRFDNLKLDAWQNDPALSGKYRLKESYSAAYASFNIVFNKTTEAKAGVRYEYSNSNLGTATERNIVDRHYGNLFPDVSLSHKINDNNTVSFSYSKRITRPTFNDLAPFTYYADAYTVITGNPALQASISNIVKASYTFKKYFVSLSYSFDKNSISSFQPSSDSVNNKITISAQNLLNLKTASAVFSVPVTVNGWWSMQYNITGIWQQVNALYQDASIRLQSVNLRLNALESFKLPSSFSAELSAFCQLPQLDGLRKNKSVGTVDIGLRKSFAGNKSSLLLTASNIFNTLSLRASTNLPEQNLVNDLNLVFGQPAVKLTFTHSFGNTQLKENRNRTTGAEEEKGRVQ